MIETVGRAGRLFARGEFSERSGDDSICEQGAKPFETDTTAAPARLTRRGLMQAAAWVAGGGLLTDGVLEPKRLLANATGDAASYLTRDRIAATPTFKYRPYRSKHSVSADATTWVQIDLEEPRRIDEVRLFPANQRLIPGKESYYPGEGFPACFRCRLRGPSLTCFPVIDAAS